MKKRKKLFGILLAVVMTVAMMTGCSAGKGGTSGSGVKDSWRRHSRRSL